MPDPNETNRERLLRLIDGGPEVLKEVQEERKPAVEEKKPVVTQIPPAKTDDLLGSVKRFSSRIQWDPANLAKIALVLVLLIAALRAASDLVGSVLRPAKSQPTDLIATPDPGAAEDLAAGLRLVGVDWGDPPVALLEDLKTGKTYFARKNDKIKETRVKEIFKNKVTVVVRGKTLELR